MALPRAVFQVRLTPKSKANRFEWDLTLRVLHVSLSAPPVDNAANEALIAAISKRFRVASGKISLVKGHRSRLKTVAIEGVEQSELENLLASVATKELE